MEQTRDRYAGLVAFGVLQILIGLLSVGLTLLISAAAGSGRLPRGASLGPALAVYGMAAVYFIAVGVGSIQARRWARALSVVVSAMSGIGGVVATVMLTIMLPRLRASLPSGAATPALGCVVGGVVIALVLIPLALFLFYRSEAVRLTCERRDRTPRWTDRVPLPVLAVVLALAFGSVTLLASLSDPVLPLFGTVITGAPAALAFLSLSFLSAFLAVQAFRLELSAWWTLVLLQVMGCVIGVLSITRMDTRSPTRTPNAPDLTGIYRDPLFMAVLIVTWFGYFAFLLYLKRYFGTIAPRTRREDY